MSEDPAPEEVFALLNDETARTILKATSQQPMTASDLLEACTASRATVYRRIDDLRNLNLLAEVTQLDPDGNHRGEFEATLDRLSVELRDGEFQFSIEQDPADRMLDVWEHL